MLSCWAWKKFYKLWARQSDYKTFMLKSAEHKISTALKLKTKITEKMFSCLKHSDGVYILLINDILAF